MQFKIAFKSVMVSSFIIQGILSSSAILSSLGALGPEPCGGPPKTIQQLFRGPLKLFSIIRLGGGRMKPLHLGKNGEENWNMVNFSCFLGKIMHFWQFSINYSLKMQ